MCGRATLVNTRMAVVVPAVPSDVKSELGTDIGGPSLWHVEWSRIASRDRGAQAAGRSPPIHM
jgi:hypothetical protein